MAGGGAERHEMMDGAGVVDEGRLIASRYRLLDRIGRGGMGTVWRAEDELLGRHVALKKLHVPPHLADDERATLYERTRREARSAARITHRNVVVVHDVVDDGGLPCIVMEYVPSRTLGEVLKQDGPVAPAEAARIGRGMIAALRAAHAAGVLHRDVKPGNVLLGADGRVVLTDFGIAVASGTSTLTRTGELVGSVDYVAPERVRGGTPGPASDLWALGATLYQAVEGRPPFRKDTAIETAYAIAVDPAPSSSRAGVLAPLIAQLLAKEPEARPSAETVEQRLREPAAEAETAAVDRAQLLAPGAGPDNTTAAEGVGSVARGSTASTAGEGAGRRAGRTTSHLAEEGPDRGPVQGPVQGPGRGPVQGSGQGSGRRSGQASDGAQRGRGRIGLWAATVVVVAAAAVGGTVLVLRGADTGVQASPGGAQTPDGKPSDSASPTPEPSPVPEGYHLVEEKELGVSFPVPDGWTRKVLEDDSEGIGYIDPTGKVGLRIAVLDLASTDPLQHWKDDEAKSRREGKLPGYRQLRMQSTRYRGQPAAIWEFTWQGSAREWRARDLGFGRPGEKEYAIYLSAPSAAWARYEPVFGHVRHGLRLPEQTS
ncbi:protein kinase [Streptomyces sp. NPDC004647]|uniref:serine/threonine protein kinase n=1 Tax=Streptomyces sp. NPDC004647 TaxID=3154671 RepID=UPI0033BE6542